MIINNKEAFMKAGDVNISSRYFKMNAFLHYRLKLD
jgi:hypothetical protein